MRQLIAIISFFSFLQAYGQQQPQYSQYMLNQYALNPAVGGTEDNGIITASYRKQWLGLDGAPQSYYLTGHVPVGKVFGDYSKAHLNKVPNFHGIGIAVYGDKSGPTSQYFAHASYAYNMKLNSYFRLSMGLFLGIKQFSINTSAIDFHDSGDPLAETGNLTKIAPDGTLGFWAYSDNYFAGLAIQHLFNNQISNDFKNMDRTYTSRLNRHLFFTAGAKLPLSENTYLVPSFMLKYVSPAPISVDFNAKAVFYDKYWVGITLRTADGIGALAGLNITESWLLGYAYEYTISKLHPYQSGSHEILLSYKLPLPGSILCPSKFW